MKILIISILCLAACSGVAAKLTKSETSPSTQSQGFFGYFGNIWKKQLPSTTSTRTLKPLRPRIPIETSTLPPAGIFGHVKNWMNAIKDKMPLKMETTTSLINHTKISGTNTRKNHSTRRIANRTIVSLNISNISTKNIKRRADTEIPGVSEFFAQLPNASNAISPETKYINSYDEFVRIETQETASAEKATTGSISSSTNTVIDINKNATIFPISGFTKDVDLEKNNSYADTSFRNPKVLESSDLNILAMKPITMKKRSGDYKLTPSNLLFYNADDLTGNTSKSESELVLTTSNYTRIRTRKSTAVKKSRSRKTTGMTSTRQRLRLKLTNEWNTPIVLTSGWLI